MIKWIDDCLSFSFLEKDTWVEIIRRGSELPVVVGYTGSEVSKGSSKGNDKEGACDEESESKVSPI